MKYFLVYPEFKKALKLGTDSKVKKAKKDYDKNPVKYFPALTYERNLFEHYCKLYFYSAQEVYDLGFTKSFKEKYLKRDGERSGMGGSTFHCYLKSNVESVIKKKNLTEALKDNLEKRVKRSENGSRAWEKRLYKEYEEAMKETAKQRESLEKRKEEEYKEAEQSVIRQKEILEDFQFNREAINKAEYFVLETATTGLDEYPNSALQISLIDNNGVIHLNMFTKARYGLSDWTDAQSLHGITPSMVKDKELANSYDLVVNEIIKDKTLYIYNKYFDLYFVNIDNPENVRCAMTLFSEVYGELHEFYDEYVYQKLSTAFKYYGGTEEDLKEMLQETEVDVDSYNSLHKCFITLFVVKHLTKETSKEINP
ncbi:3'-5' exonuclease [Flammeovirga agarivorans]|uniref:Exonuclease domain-containing protein n=1 Tax=Flammeovirga agarivorans TaxID=2726742 RepID=A0A7X8SRA2_9BACT|nr:hypothetical protein [Flammeovirga agarivorans]NLR94962.1 hypothetical protein [Flammeovirga agarivorans]